MMIRIFLLAAACAAFFMAAFPAPADAAHEPLSLEREYFQIGCAPVAKLDHMLRSKLGAAPIRRGRLNQAADRVFQLYRNEDGSKWAVTVVYGDGTECLILFGDDLEAVPWILRKRKSI